MLPFRHLMLAILVPFCWGINAPIVKVAIHYMPPLWFSCFRCLLLATLVIFYPQPPTSMKKIGSFALCNGFKISFLYYSLYVGLAAGLSTVISQADSLFAVLFAILIFREHISLKTTLGLVLAFVGVAVIGFDPELSVNTIGMVFVLVSAVFSGLSFLILKSKQTINYMAFVGWFNFISIIPFGIVAFLLEGPEPLFKFAHHVSLEYIWLLFLSALTVIGAYVLLMYLLTRYPTSKIAPYSLLVPLFGVSSSWIWLGETIDPQALLGSGIIIIGLAINQVADTPFWRRKNTAVENMQ